MNNTEIRKFYNDVLSTVNKYSLPMEVKRITLEAIMNKCENNATIEIINENKTITEEGEMNNGTELD